MLNSNYVFGNLNFLQLFQSILTIKHLFIYMYYMFKCKHTYMIKQYSLLNNLKIYLKYSTRMAATVD